MTLYTPSEALRVHRRYKDFDARNSSARKKAFTMESVMFSSFMVSSSGGGGGGGEDTGGMQAGGEDDKDITLSRQAWDDQKQQNQSVIP